MTMPPARSNALDTDSRMGLNASRDFSSSYANAHVNARSIHRLVTVAHAAPVSPNAGIVIFATVMPLMRTWLSATFVALAMVMATTKGRNTLVDMSDRRIAWKSSTGRMPHASMWQ